MIKDIKLIEGSGGGGKSQSPPIEDPNTLQSRAVARIIDVICEGEIEGFYNSTIEKSIFFNNTPLKDASSNYNFQGVSTDFKEGLPDQDYISGFPNVETEVGVGVEIKKSIGPIVRTVSDQNVEDIRVTISTPRLAMVTEEGDILRTEAAVSVYIEADGGGYTLVKTIVLAGKCIASYQRSYLIKNISQYGSAPWNIKITRITDDSETSKLSNSTFWTSYTSIINEKMIYPNTTLIGITVDSEQFGDRIPTRSYDIKGLKVKVPNNYTVATRTYSGEWSGTFKTEWCDNPAWVYYDLLTNDRYGMGLDPDKVDKWALYTIAQYCDVYIDDGYGSTEPRYTCNLVINVRKEAIHVLNLLTSVFRGMPLWSSGLATVIQDKPKDPSRLVSDVNVINGEFNYEGSGLKARHTVVKVSWNDIDDFCRKQVEYVEDVAGISQYGWKPLEVYAYGTTSRGQAHRVGKWLLTSELYETEIVQFKAGFDHADVLPGDIIEISDSHYTGGITHRYSGRIVSSTSITVTIDNTFKIESGKTYTLAVVLPDGSLDDAIEIINAPGDTTVLEVAESFSTQPQNHAVWMITASDVVPRTFRIISNTENEPNVFDIVALYYDSNKFAKIEGDIYFDEIAESAIPIGALTPPNDLAGEEYQYNEGGAYLYGTLLSWGHADDPRKIYYDIQYKLDYEGIYIKAGTTVDNSYDIRPVTSGIYDYRVRTVSSNDYSSWASLTDFSVEADNTTCSGVENLQVLGGGTTFSGPDCEIEWDDSECHILKGYKVEVYKIDDTLLRTDYTTLSNYDYTYQMNADDNSNVPVRDIKFKVYTQNIYDRVGPSETLIVENPAPSMDSLTPVLTQRYGGITIDWDNITPTDNDMWKYKVYGNDSSPPTEIIYQCDAETTYFHWFGLDVGTIYYIQIEPYDYFGVGVKSDIVGEEPIVIPGGNVDVGVELLTSIAMSDSDENSAATLGKLYDRNKISEGVSYTVSGTNKYIQYKYAVEDLFDRVIIYTADANTHAFIAYSSNGTAWNYLSGEADHTLADDELVTASGISEAETNYWQLSSGTNVAIYPAMITGSYMRLYLTGNYTTTIYELVFYREIVAEMAAIDTLSALSANCGTLTAGVIQSSTYGADKGILVDLDNDRMILGGSSDPVMDIDADAGTGTFKGVFTFESGTDGYAEITDKPTTLSGINSTEGTKLEGVEEGADVTGDNTSADTSAVNGLASSSVSGWAHTSDTTKIDGGDIYTNTVTANQIAANTITASEIDADTITATEIASSTITATEMNVSNLAAISADMGTITAGSMDAARITAGTLLVARTEAKCTDPNADQTSTNTSADAAAYTGTSISTTYTAAKCTDADADQTSTNTSADAAAYTGASISTSYTAAKCTDANADQTSVNTSNNTSNVGTCPATTVAGWRYGSTTYINGGDIYTNTVTAAKINVTTLSSMSANMGTITAGTITISTTGYIRGGQTGYATGTGFFLGYSSGYKFSVGNTTNYIKWDGSTLHIGGKILATENFEDWTVGNSPLISANTEASIDDVVSYVKVKEISLAQGGALRIKFDMKAEDSNTWSYGRIYKNGFSEGILRSHYGDSWTTYSQDISGWDAGDLLQLYLSNYPSGKPGYIKNFQVFCGNPTETTVVLD